MVLVKLIARPLPCGPVLSACSALFPAPSLLQAQYELVKKTNMVDYAQQLFSSINPDKDDPAGTSNPSSPLLTSPRVTLGCPKGSVAQLKLIRRLCSCACVEFASRREEVAAKNTSLAAAAEQVLDVISKPEVAGQLKQDKDQNLIWLKDNYQVSTQASPYHGHHLAGRAQEGGRGGSFGGASGGQRTQRMRQSGSLQRAALRQRRNMGSHAVMEGTQGMLAVLAWAVRHQGGQAEGRKVELNASSTFSDKLAGRPHTP